MKIEDVKKIIVDPRKRKITFVDYLGNKETYKNKSEYLALIDGMIKAKIISLNDVEVVED